MSSPQIPDAPTEPQVDADFCTCNTRIAAAAAPAGQVDWNRVIDNLLFMEELFMEERSDCFDIAMAEEKAPIQDSLQSRTLLQHLKSDSARFPTDNDLCGELSWATRYRIIEGICTGLVYLHEKASASVIHMDLKPENILLDDCCVPKIADFGLSRLLDDSSNAAAPKLSAAGTNNSPSYAEFAVAASAKGGAEIKIGSHVIPVPKFLSVHHPLAQMLLFARNKFADTFACCKSMTPKSIFDIAKRLHASGLSNWGKTIWNLANPKSESPKLGTFSDFSTSQSIVRRNEHTENESHPSFSFSSDPTIRSMAPMATAAAAPAPAVGSRVTALGVAACERDVEKLEFIEEKIKNFDAEQTRVLAEILARNGGTEYLRRHGMEGRMDRQAFKARVPVVTYEDLRPEIDRIANGDRSNIISSHPITEFLTSSGTSAGERKLMPTIEDELNRRTMLYSLLMPVMNLDNDDCGKLSWANCCDITKGNCSGFKHLFKKPQNILLDNGCVPKISNFGISRYLHGRHNTAAPKVRATGTHNSPGYVDFAVAASAKGGAEIKIGSHVIRVPEYLSVHHPLAQMVLFARNKFADTFACCKPMTPKSIFDIAKRLHAFGLSNWGKTIWNSAKPKSDSPKVGTFSDFSTSQSIVRRNEHTENESHPSDTDASGAAWVAATAAPHHATGSRELLSGFTMDHDDKFVHAVDGVPRKVLACGTVITDSVVLPDVWFVPGLTENLVSVSQLVELDHSVGFSCGECCIRRADGKVVGKGHLQEGGLYVLDFLKVPLAI